MPVPSDELARRVMEALECRTVREFVKALGFTDPDAEKRVRRWLAGENAPDYDNTIHLLERAGLLALETEPKRPSRRRDPALAEVAAALRASAQHLAELAESLEEEVA